ncbi:hypothetical protein P9112_003577 [Eukaryota sp. TZLM1-RC]
MISRLKELLPDYHRPYSKNALLFEGRLSQRFQNARGHRTQPRTQNKKKVKKKPFIDDPVLNQKISTSNRPLICSIDIETKEIGTEITKKKDVNKALDNLRAQQKKSQSDRHRQMTDDEHLLEQQVFLERQEILMISMILFEIDYYIWDTIFHSSSIDYVANFEGTRRVFLWTNDDKPVFNVSLNRCNHEKDLLKSFAEFTYDKKLLVS